MKLFAKRFYGFNPEIFPVITFSKDGSRDALLRSADIRDRILYVAVKGHEAQAHEKGRILGMAEIGRTPVSSEDMIPEGHVFPDNYYEGGKLRWPEGIPMIKAWRFDTPPLLTDVIDQLTQAARSNAVLLDEDEKNFILDLPHHEVTLPISKKLELLRDQDSALHSNLPIEWKQAMNKMAARILNTVKQSKGEPVLKKMKTKNCSMNSTDLELFLVAKLEEQQRKCKITGRALEINGNHWLQPSPDRIDSNGHYEKDNIQIVSKAANLAKSDLEDEKVEGFFEALQFARNPIKQ